MSLVSAWRFFVSAKDEPAAAPTDQEMKSSAGGSWSLVQVSLDDLDRRQTGV